MLSFMKKIPWWLWIGAFVAVFLIWQNLSGWAMSRKLYDMALDNLRQDQSKIVRILEETITEREREIAGLEVEIQDVKKQRAVAQAENERLKGKISELQSQRENIVVPSDPGGIVTELRGLGFGSVYRHHR